MLNLMLYVMLMLTLKQEVLVINLAEGQLHDTVIVLWSHLTTDFQPLEHIFDTEMAANFGDSNPDIIWQADADRANYQIEALKWAIVITGQAGHNGGRHYRADISIL